MPRQPLDLERKIKDILQHVGNLPVEADSPLAHYDRTSSDHSNLLTYMEKVIAMAAGRLYATATQRHLERLHGMMLVNLIECFERFLKEIAAACVDQLAPFASTIVSMRFRFEAAPSHPTLERLPWVVPCANPRLGWIAPR